MKRLATSFVLAAREAGHPDELCGDIVLSLVRTYREAMRRFAGIPVLELFRHVLTRQGTDGAVADLLAKAERASPAVTLRKLTSAGSDGTRKFLEHPPLLTPVAPSQARKILASLKPYRDTITLDRRLVLEAYRPVAAAFKVVGIGSVGLRDFVIYGCGAGPDDPLFLQVKEMPASCYAAVLPEARGNGHQGQRVAQAQQRMQSVSDPLLGWTTIDGVDYLVRQLADHKASIDPAALRGSELEEYAVVCGEIFARTHARTGDPAVLTGYCGASDRLDKAIRKFALVYADRTAADHAALVAAIANGRLESWAV